MWSRNLEIFHVYSFQFSNFTCGKPFFFVLFTENANSLYNSSVEKKILNKYTKLRLMDGKIYTAFV